MFSEGRPRRPKPCRNFVQTGYCRFGLNCRYDHPSPVGSRSASGRESATKPCTRKTDSTPSRNDTENRKDAQNHKPHEPDGGAAAEAEPPPSAAKCSMQTWRVHSKLRWLQEELLSAQSNAHLQLRTMDDQKLKRALGQGGSGSDHTSELLRHEFDSVLGKMANWQIEVRELLKTIESDQPGVVDSGVPVGDIGGKSDGPSTSVASKRAQTATETKDDRPPPEASTPLPTSVPDPKSPAPNLEEQKFRPVHSKSDPLSFEILREADSIVKDALRKVWSIHAAATSGGASATSPLAARSPGHTAASPGHTAGSSGQAAGFSGTGSSNHASGHTPHHTSDHTPSHTSNHTTGHVSDHTPSHTTSHSAATPAPGHTKGHTTGHTTRHTTGHTTGHTSGHTTSHTTGHTTGLTTATSAPGHATTHTTTATSASGHGAGHTTSTSAAGYAPVHTSASHGRESTPRSSGPASAAADSPKSSNNSFSRKADSSPFWDDFGEDTSTTVPDQHHKQKKKKSKKAQAAQQTASKSAQVNAVPSVTRDTPSAAPWPPVNHRTQGTTQCPYHKTHQETSQFQPQPQPVGKAAANSNDGPTSRQTTTGNETLTGKGPSSGNESLSSGQAVKGGAPVKSKGASHGKQPPVGKDKASAAPVSTQPTPSPQQRPDHYAAAGAQNGTNQPAASKSHSPASESTAAQSHNGSVQNGTSHSGASLSAAAKRKSANNQGADTWTSGSACGENGSVSGPNGATQNVYSCAGHGSQTTIDLSVPKGDGARQNAAAKGENVPAVSASAPPLPTPSKALIEAARAKSAAMKAKANEMYKRKNFAVAEEKYHLAIKELERLGAGVSAVAQDLSVLYSNRAGARLMKGAVQSALEDSVHSTKLDPTFVRAYARACTCYVRLGRVHEAEKHLQEGLQHLLCHSDKRKELQAKQAELAELLQQRQKLVDAVHLDLSCEQLQKLQVECANVYEEMRDCEIMKEVKALMKLRCALLSEVITCEHPRSLDVSGRMEWWINLQGNFHAGNFDDVIVLAEDGIMDPTLETEKPFLDVISYPSKAELQDLIKYVEDLQRLKQEGNDAVHLQDWQEAIDKYTKALAMQPPLPFSAVLHCNRAVAHDKLQHKVDALADAARAKALNPQYTKAYHRLANLLSGMNRAAIAVSILMSMAEHCGDHVDEADHLERLRDAKSRSRLESTPDHYQFLELQRTCSDNEIRKAYKRMALRYHPDKALCSCKFGLRMGESGIKLAVGGAVEKRIHEEASSLFSYIGQAHEELGDKARRRKVDMLLDESCSHHSGSAYSDYFSRHDSCYGSSRAPRAYPGYYEATSSSSPYGATPAQAWWSHYYGDDDESDADYELDDDYDNAGYHGYSRY